jgi:hypothetical protein
VLLALFLLAAQPARPAARAPALPGGLDAFTDPAVAEALGTFDPSPGAWAEYAISPVKGQKTRLRIAVLAPRLPDGRYWLETASQAQDGPPIGVKMLVHGAPGRVENVERIYVYMGGQAPLELPLPDLRDDLRAPERKPPPQVRRKGTQTVSVPAGEFAADLLEIRSSRIWRSAKVPLWGLVRAQQPGRRIELVGFGVQGAETVFPPGFDDASPQGNGKERVK